MPSKKLTKDYSTISVEIVDGFVRGCRELESLTNRPFRGFMPMVYFNIP